ncbi:N-acetyltransferase [Ectobacillus sp. JY-23]|uniref:N-acetyltransferase n=1 Tax=Ectobacillus sp. JY-23 TaxID=2933872 RepID=UPI001FF3EA39|nr:N-acetyltransferase [Ectobacillus sp. JY-23]UOY93740.1 N-acetyltransferase [Ectobacillus sp. JY-23]
MYIPKVERLLVNYKTLEEFKKFKRYGEQELSMLEDLQANIIEDNSESPFYGIYFGESLVARMSLYETEDYIELYKLEVLPTLQRKGFGSALVDYAKSLRQPIKTIARVQSELFWEKQGFEKVVIKDAPFYIWRPQPNVDAVSGESA